ncbi:MAG: hypothetical protein JNL21_27615 [Myxococcales bacterium]|nr:hypothetical protein [Myxococcales bacterium]
MSARAALSRLQRFGSSAARRMADRFTALGGRPDGRTQADRDALARVLDEELRRPGARPGLVAELERLKAELGGGL